MLWLIVLLLLIAVLFGGYGGPRLGWGGWGWSPLGVILVVLLILWLFGAFGGVRRW